MKIWFIAPNYYVLGTNQGGTTYIFDRLMYLSSDSTSSVIFSHILHTLDTTKTIECDVVLIYVCNTPDSSWYAPLVPYLKKIGKPIVWFADDYFYVDMIASNIFYTDIDALILSTKQSSCVAHYKRLHPIPVYEFEHPVINTNIYKDYNLPKIYDITLYGTINETMLKANFNDYVLRKFEGRVVPDEINFYSFRKRVHDLILSNKHKYIINHIQASQSASYHSIIRGTELSKQLNQSYLSVATGAIVNKAMAKYWEIGASKCAIVGDMPEDYRDVLEGNMFEITEDMTDSEILSVIDGALADKKKLESDSKVFSDFIVNTYGSNSLIPMNNFKSILEKIILK